MSACMLQTPNDWVGGAEYDNVGLNKGGEQADQAESGVLACTNLLW